MKVFETKLHNVSVVTGGRARITLKGAAAHFGSVDRIQFVVQRGDPSAPYLMPGRWGASEHRFTTTDVILGSTDVTFEVGPEIVDMIDEYTQVLFQFPNHDAGAQTVWTGITPTVGASGMGPLVDHRAEQASRERRERELAEAEARRRKAEADAEARRLAEEREKEEADQRARLAAEEAARREAEEVARIAEEKAREEAEARALEEEESRRGAEGGDPPVPGPRPKPPLSLILGGLAGLVAVAIAVWFFGFRDPAPREPIDPLAQRHADAVRALRRDQCEVARSLFSELDASDYGPSLIVLAEQTDSFQFEPCLRERPNDVRAIDLYSRACTAGEAEAAGEGLQQLKTRLEQSGDELAREVLRLKMPDAEEACGLE